MKALLIKNCRIARAEHAELIDADVFIENGKITALDSALNAPADVPCIEARRRILMPAMFDAHVHFREPGFEAKETIASGVSAAINGGVTGVVMMPNTAPAIDSATVVRTVLDLASRQAPITVLTSACITKGRAGKELAAYDSLYALGVRMLTDDGDSVHDPAVLYRAMQYATPFGMFFASHCEVPELAGPRALNDGPQAYQLGIKGSPACAEEIMIDRDIRLAHATGAHIHIQHVSSALGMETIRWWKERGARVTAEVAPHHLMFHEGDIGDFDTHYKMNPPLRRREDNQALLQGLKDGVFDLIATDHAPHTPFEKSQDFVSAPNGITGLDTALLSLYDRYVRTGELTWNLIIERFSAQPRRMMGLPAVQIACNADVDFLLFDPEATTWIDRAFLKSKSINTPFLGQSLRGSIDLVIKGSHLLLDRHDELHTATVPGA